MIGLLGKGILLIPAIWVVFGNVRSVQLVLSYLLWCKHIADYLMRNHLQCWWQRQRECWIPHLWQLTILVIQPKDFSRTDLYSCRRWRWVQRTVNEFWCHWRKEFLQSLQERKKWTNTKRNLKVGDIVILQEANTIRNNWQMRRVIQTHCDEKGFVRSEEVDEKVLESPPREPWIKCNVISRCHVSWRGAMY